MNLYEEFIDSEMLRPDPVSELVDALDQLKDWDKRNFSLDCLVRDINSDASEEAYAGLGKFIYRMWRMRTEELVGQNFEGYDTTGQEDHLDEWEGE